MERVAVVGAVGSGKSTFARALAERSRLPLIVLDDCCWRSGPVPTDAEWAQRHAELVAADRWVIDGDHRAVAPARFARADTIVWIDPWIGRRWWQIARRARHGHPAGFWECIRWTTRYPRHGRPETAAALAQPSVAASVRRFRSRRQQRRFLATVTTVVGAPPTATVTG